MPCLDSAPSQILGVDIAKDTVTFFDSQSRTTRTIANERRAIGRILGASSRDCMVVCEPTGGHERPLLEECLKAGRPVHRADTTKLKAFIRSLGRLGKTDAIDAALLAAYGRERWPILTLWMPPGAEQDRLQTLVRRRRELIAMRVAETNRAKAPAAPGLAASFKAMLRAIESQIERIGKLIDALIAKSQRLSRRVAVCAAMHGIGRKTAENLLGLMPELGTLSRRQAASLAGLAPHPNESGTIKGYRRMRGGRRDIPCLLFMPALAAARGKGEFAAFYRRLVANGKKPILAVAAVMRKIVITINARLRDVELQQS